MTLPFTAKRPETNAEARAARALTSQVKLHPKEVSIASLTRTFTPKTL